MEGSLSQSRSRCTTSVAASLHAYCVELCSHQELCYPITKWTRSATVSYTSRHYNDYTVDRNVWTSAHLTDGNCPVVWMTCWLTDRQVDTILQSCRSIGHLSMVRRKQVSSTMSSATICIRVRACLAACILFVWQVCSTSRGSSDVRRYNWCGCDRRAAGILYIGCVSVLL
jgi:hypothetical protein